MTERTEKSETFCEIAGCTGTAVREVWSVDEKRHLRVCWKHVGDDVDDTAIDSE